jgi:hypothetical protein
MSYVLSVVDTAGIQNYIFGSNRLRENVGASEHVLRATTDWVWETLKQEHLRVNWQPGEQPRDDDKKIEHDDLDAEVIYAGGGNALILFKDGGTAQSWARQLSKKALTDAPGMTVLVAHSEPFDWQAGGSDLAYRVEDLFELRLDQLKRTRVTSTPLLGLGVTATCQSTGLVATEVDSIDQIRVSREVAAKTSVLNDAKARFRVLLQDYNHLGFELPVQLDDLNPTKGERSYIAVVHADGNGIGTRFKTIWQGKTNRDGVTAVRHLSDNLARLASTALRRALSGLVTPTSLIKPYGDRGIFPVRPLIYGGDDLTFVCDGYVGVGLAARYLHEFEKYSKELVGEPLTAAAGVAIVKTHYPFARAYALSEALNKQAKRLSRDVSTLDWHVAMSGTLADIHEIRLREYTVGAGDLAMRPVYLQDIPEDKATEDWRTWHNVEHIIHSFQTDDTWAGKRNKIKQLRDVLRDGPDAVRQFRGVYQTGELPGYHTRSTLRQDGWINDCCGYFDPIELLDLYVPPFSNSKESQWLPTS